MQQPVQITFRHLPHSDAIETNILEHANKLEHYFQPIIHCRVVIEPAPQHKHQGNLYHVHLDVGVPGRQLVVNREPSKHQAHQDLYVSIRDAFNAMQRQLEDYARTTRGQVKPHHQYSCGKISDLLPHENRGIILTPDGVEIGFSQNSVKNIDYFDLQPGDEVEFIQMEDDHGLHATAVQPIR